MIDPVGQIPHPPYPFPVTVSQGVWTNQHNVNQWTKKMLTHSIHWTYDALTAAKQWQLKGHTP